MIEILCIILGAAVFSLLATLYVREKVHRDQLYVIAQEFDERANKIMFAQDIMTGADDLREMLETQRRNGYEDGFAAGLRHAAPQPGGLLQQALGHLPIESHARLVASQKPGGQWFTGHDNTPMTCIPDRMWIEPL